MNDFHRNGERCLKKIQAYIARMPSLPTTVIKVLETCNDPNTSAYDLKRVVSLDPVLTGRVLKLINSAYYSLGRPLTSLTRAIILLGINNVKNLALSFAILDNFKHKRTGRSFSADEFWTHSLGVGVVAKSLAALKEIPSAVREEFFIAGLLHDLGKLPLRTQFPAEYCSVWESARRHDHQLYQCEMRHLGVDHCAVGQLIAQKWRLGPSLVESLSHHHNPDESSEENRDFVSVVALANQWANEFNIGNAGNNAVDHSMIANLIGKVAVDWSILSNLRETVLNEIEKAKVFLEVVRND
ncbi:MAG: HDOD domain-containing protein [Desulfobacterales bacterium]|nr:MAG: HDOD domain-containing protein [Desulfobacterales bacterium]